MSYEKQNFVDGQTLTAAHLNHMEAGIVAAEQTGGSGGTADLTIGTVTSGDTASASISGGKLNLVLPKGEGFTENAKTLILSLFENALYKDSQMKAQLDALRAEWGAGGDTVPVQSVSLSAATLTLTEGDSQTLTATVLPANATNRTVIWTVSPSGYATVAGGKVTAVQAGSCKVTATAGGKSASCAVTVEEAETAELLYTLPGETVISASSGTCLNTGLKLLEHASTETPQYTILLEAKGGDSLDANKWPDLVHCLTETGNTSNLPGFSACTYPTDGKTHFAYYSFGFDDAILCDTVEHAKTKTRYVIQLDGTKFRVGSTYCTLSAWKQTQATISDVPQTFLIGAAQNAEGTTKQQFWDGTIYQCKVYKGLLSDSKVQSFIGGD